MPCREGFMLAAASNIRVLSMGSCPRVGAPNHGGYWFMNGRDCSIGFEKTGPLPTLGPNCFH